MVKTKRKTNLVILAIATSIALAFAMAAALFKMPATETAYAAGTRQLDTITIADMYANRNTGKFGNYSWDPSKLKEITSSSFTIGASVAAGYQPFYICWTKPSGTAYPGKLNYGYTIGTGVNGDSASKKWTSTFPSDVSFSGIKTYPVGEVSLNDNYDTIYFCIGHSYMYDDLVVTSITFQPKVNTVKVTATAGAGVKSVYLSKDKNATSGSNSGTVFDKGDTVYAFAKLAEGYKRPNSNWTLVSGTADTADAIYRTNSYTMGTSDYNFGTINAAAKTKTLSRNTNGGGYMSGITLTYGQAANLTVPTREGYSFLGWNTNSEGTGTTYGNGSAAELTPSQVNAIIDDNSIGTVYAMWKIVPETVIGFIDQIPDPVVYTQDCKNAIDRARSGYSDLGDEEKTLVTNYGTLTAAEATYNGMQADKESLDAYKTEKKADADSLARAGDSAACGTLIANAKSDIDDLVYDCTKTIAENKAAADDIVTALESGLYNQRMADEVAEYIDEIDNPVTLASKAGIDTARVLYDGLSDNQKPLVGNYDKLTDAEAAYADLLVNCEAKIGNNYYMTLLDAYTEAAENATITINKDYDVTGRGDPYINVTKDVTIDLAGRTLTIGQGDSVVVTEGAVLSIKNSVPETGGIKGEAGVDQSSGAYLLLFDCRLALNAETIKQYESINHVAEGYLVENINNGDADENGYYSVVRPITAVDITKAYIDAIPETVVYTQDCKDAIDKSRESFDKLTEAEQARVENKQDLLDAEAAYKVLDDQAKADAVKELIEAIGEVEYTEESKGKIDAARRGYDGLAEDQKTLVGNYDVLTAAEATYAELEEKANAKLSGGTIAGIVVGCVALVAIVALLLWFYIFKKEKDEPKNE